MCGKLEPSAHLPAGVRLEAHASDGETGRRAGCSVGGGGREVAVQRRESRRFSRIDRSSLPVSTSAGGRGGGGGVGHGRSAIAAPSSSSSSGGEGGGEAARGASALRESSVLSLLSSRLCMRRSTRSFGRPGSTNVGGRPRACSREDVEAEEWAKERDAGGEGGADAAPRSVEALEPSLDRTRRSVAALGGEGGAGSEVWLTEAASERPASSETSAATTAHALRICAWVWVSPSDGSSWADPSGPAA